MIVDSSAVIAVLLKEPGYDLIISRLAGSTSAGLGAPTLAETGIVLAAKLGMPGRTLLSRFVDESGLAVVPFGDDHWGVATEAFVRFGKGRDPAGLNFGDCLTYAVARLSGEPLLCLGNDFAQTDLTLAL